MSRTAQFAVNAAANYARMGIQIAAFAVLTPYVIAKIGTGDYGLWTLVLSPLGFLNLLDLGFGTGVVKYVAECQVSGDVERRNRILSTLGVGYAGILAVSAVAVILLAAFFNQMFAIPAEQQPKATAVLWILAVRFALAIPLSLYRNALYGEQRVHLINLAGVIGILAQAVGSWLVLMFGYGVLALAWVNLTAMLIEYVAYAWFAYRTMNGLRISPELFDRPFLKEVSSFSGAQFLINIAALILLRTDPIIVKAFLPLSAVAIYGVALKIAENAYLLTKQFTNLLGPLAAQLRQSAENIKIRFILINCTKFAMAPSVMLTVAMYVLGRETIVFWVRNPDFAPGGAILIVLLTSMTLSMAQETSSAVLSMTGHHRITATAAVVSVVTNVGLSVLLAKLVGLIGIALGTLGATLLVNLLITVRRACQIHGITYRDYIARALAPALLPGAAQFAVTLGLKYWNSPAGLLSTIILTIPGAIMYCILFWFFSIEQSEKDLLVSKLLKRYRPLKVATET